MWLTGVGLTRDYLPQPWPARPPRADILYAAFLVRPATDIHFEMQVLNSERWNLTILYLRVSQPLFTCIIGVNSYISYCILDR